MGMGEIREWRLRLRLLRLRLRLRDPTVAPGPVCTACGVGPAIAAQIRDRTPQTRGGTTDPHAPPLRTRTRATRQHSTRRGKSSSVIYSGTCSRSAHDYCASEPRNGRTRRARTSTPAPSRTGSRRTSSSLVKLQPGERAVQVEAVDGRAQIGATPLEAPVGAVVAVMAGVLAQARHA